jgi:hypothetical protein
MAPPTQETITAAIAALRDDGATWRLASADLETAARAAAGLTLDGGAFSAVGDLTGLTAAYGALRRHVARLLLEGARQDAATAAALDAAAAGYERDENDAVHRLRQAW